MSSINIDEYKEEHESEEQWELRKAFLLHWRDKFSEERLLCLARVFTNIEFMGCRYPQEVMKEVSHLSEEVAKNYRARKKTMLQRTFVSASDAAEDRARGVKRVGGVINDAVVSKSVKIDFVAQGQEVEETEEESKIELDISDEEKNRVIEAAQTDIRVAIEEHNYLEELRNRQNLNVSMFNERMFQTEFGRLVLIARSWMCKLTNLQSSCSACGLIFQTDYSAGNCVIKINDKLVSSCSGNTKQIAKANGTELAWKNILKKCITVVVKEQFIAHGDSRITSCDVSNNANQTQEIGFGTPVDSSVAAKMMKLMGWSGGGLGIKCNGISEPIQPNLQQIHRAGLGSRSTGGGAEGLRGAAMRLMREYSAGDTLDVDLVFANDFNKEERAELHQIAKRCGLISRSYGKDAERFLVVKKKLDPFNLVRAVLQKGGETNKYQIFIPRELHHKAAR